MLSRRKLIGKAAIGAAAAVALGAARTGVASVRGIRGTTNEPTSGPGDTGHVAEGGDGRNPPPPSPEELKAVTAPPPAEAPTATLPPPWQLLRPLVAGSAVAHGWRVVDLGPIENGSCVVTLRNARGRLQRIHLCRNDGSPQGVIYTRRLDLVVMNDGHGEQPTEERLAQAIARLAHVIARNERRAADAIFAELMPHAERLRRFASAEAQLR